MKLFIQKKSKREKLKPPIHEMDSTCIGYNSAIMSHYRKGYCQGECSFSAPRQGAQIVFNTPSIRLAQRPLMDPSPPVHKAV
ncbi:hypothetical protein J6590_019142 [Homalodisca vitripennis]|nr:hypothetical protein J6590_019142 [Homalodisca vitripennis]